VASGLGDDEEDEVHMPAPTQHHGQAVERWSNDAHMTSARALSSGGILHIQGWRWLLTVSSMSNCAAKSRAWRASQVSLIYRSDAQPVLPAAPGAMRYSLQMVDSLVNLTVIRDIVLGAP
jgi:hypothetical protein